MGEFNLKEFDKKRKMIADVKSGKAEIAGWVYNSRALGKIKFLLLKDISGLIQITAVKGKVNTKIFEMMDKITSESVVYVKGSVKTSKQAPGGREIVPDELIVLAEAEALPIDVSDFSKTELPKRLDYRFLDFHRKRVQAIFKIQGEITNAFKEYFYKKGFLEMQAPCIISNASEGGTDLFEIKYFEKKAYLAQSPQLYKQMVACSIGKTFMITPVWRAEKHNTTRHINEIKQMDIEAPFMGQMEIMKELEEVVRYIVSQVIKKCKEELQLLGMKNLKVPKAKYIGYDETVKLLGMRYGEDLSPEDERKLDRKFPDSIVFVHDWPLSLKPFYIMPKTLNKGEKLSEGFDAIYKGLEITSGGQRIHLPELLIERLKNKGLNPKNFKSYIDSFRFGALPHSGWSIGLERLTQLLCGLSNIKEATMFPRDRDRLTP